MGVPGVQGAPGSTGPAWLTQPQPTELFRSVLRAAANVSPRTVIDPRVGFRYLTTLASKVVQLQGGLVLRVITPTDDTTEADTSTDLRYIA